MLQIHLSAWNCTNSIVFGKLNVKKNGERNRRETFIPRAKCKGKYGIIIGNIIWSMYYAFKSLFTTNLPFA